MMIQVHEQLLFPLIISFNIKRTKKLKKWKYLLNWIEIFLIDQKNFKFTRKNKFEWERVPTSIESSLKLRTVN